MDIYDISVILRSVLLLTVSAMNHVMLPAVVMLPVLFFCQLGLRLVSGNRLLGFMLLLEVAEDEKLVLGVSHLSMELNLVTNGSNWFRVISRKRFLTLVIFRFPLKSLQRS